MYSMAFGFHDHADPTTRLKVHEAGLSSIVTR